MKFICCVMLAQAGSSIYTPGNSVPGREWEEPGRAYCQSGGYIENALISLARRLDHTSYSFAAGRTHGGSIRYLFTCSLATCRGLSFKHNMTLVSGSDPLTIGLRLALFV